MNSLISAREKIKSFYDGSATYLLPVLKFLFALALLFILSRELGYVEVLGKVPVMLLLAVICAILPVNGTVVIGIAVIIINCFGIGIEIGVFALMIYVLMLLLVFSFMPKDGLALLLTPFAFMFRMPAAIPVGLGLMRKAAAAVSAVCCVFSWHFLQQLPEAASLKAAGELSSLDLLKKLLDNVLYNKDFLVACVVFLVVTLVVYFIRVSASNYSWGIAIIAGNAAYFILRMIGGVIAGVELDVIAELINTLVSLVVSFVLAFFMYSVDYKGARFLQFEDDEYYYYVKAIPKNSSAAASDENPELEGVKEEISYAYTEDEQPDGEEEDVRKESPVTYDTQIFEKNLETKLNDLQKKD